MIFPKQVVEVMKPGRDASMCLHASHFPALAAAGVTAGRPGTLPHARTLKGEEQTSLGSPDETTWTLAIRGFVTRGAGLSLRGRPVIAMSILMRGRNKS